MYTLDVVLFAFSRRARLIMLLSACSLFGACGGGGGGGTDAVADNNQDPVNQADPLDTELALLIEEAGLTGDAAFNRTLPSINDPLAELGKKLFFSKSLGGDLDSACVSCHHPVLGGSDQLSLPVGVGATNPDLLGPGREHAADGLPNVPRNSPTVFNAGLWDSGMFHDSRVESFGKEAFANGAVSDIRTPDTAFGIADVNAGANLPAAQARFPVTSVEEMRGVSFAAGADNTTVRDHLAARIGDYGSGEGSLPLNQWLAEFQLAFASSDGAESLIVYDNIALALAEYQRSMVFTNNPFADYINGDLTALTDAQKRGAILFYTDADDGGAHCANCHSGDKFTDEQHHIVAFPQFGHGKGDTNLDDFGRERETADAADRYRFRTPSLLNVEMTAPYGHAGAYATLQQVLQHYNNAQDTVTDFFDDDAACSLAQFADLAECADLYPEAQQNSNAALDKLADERDAGTAEFVNLNLNNDERGDLVAFLRSLTDPCTQSRTCLAPWIADNQEAGPDNQQLNAVDEEGNLL